METLHFDHEGRLVLYDRVADSLLPAVAAPDWSAVFREGDLELTRFTEAPPQWIPPHGYERRFAWTGTHKSATDIPLRVEAATLGGRVVLFRVVEPWETPPAAVAPGLDALDVVSVLTAISACFLLFLARRNVMRGRADVRGAWRLALFIAVVQLIGSASAAIPVLLPRAAWLLFAQLAGLAMFVVVMGVGGYLAIEPYIRRRWPHMLIGLSRLLQGRLRDPMLGRDVLVGLACGAAVVALRAMLAVVFNATGFIVEPPVNKLGHASFDTASSILFGFSEPILIAIVWGFGWLGLLFLLRLIVRRDSLAFVLLAVVLSTPAIFFVSVASQIASVCLAILAAWLFHRFGIVAVCAMLFARLILFATPLTFDFTEWYAGRSTIVLAVMLVVGAWAFYLSLAGKPLFGRIMAEEEQPAT